MHSNGCLGCSFCDEEGWQLLKAKREAKGLTVKLEYFFVRAFNPSNLKKGVY